MLGTPPYFGCTLWEKRQPPVPTEYRPGDGPFWAEHTEDGWGVFADGKWRYGYGDEAIIPAMGSAKREVDALNRVCREWAEGHAMHILAEKYGSVSVSYP